jgi:hypothetical protein
MERVQLKGQQRTGDNMTAFGGIRCSNVDKTEEAHKKLRHSYMLVHLKLPCFYEAIT